MHTPLGRFGLLSLLLVTALLAACQPTAEVMPRLDDPAEILQEGLRTTAELDFVHARLDLNAQMDGIPAGQGTVTVDADIDLDRRNFHATVGGPIVMGGGGSAELLLIGTDMFMRTSGGDDPNLAPKWVRSSLGAGADPRAGIPPNPAIAVALNALLEDESLETELKGMEACGDGQCYVVVATIAPDLIWRAVSGGLFGAPPDTEVPPVDPSIPAVPLDIRVDEATRRVVSLATTISYQGTTIEATIALSNHDVKFDLVPPPPDQIDDNSGGFGVEGMPAVPVPEIAPLPSS